MNYYVFSEKRPHVLKVFHSRDGLDELLSHDHHRGRDWGANDVVIDGEGRKGTISYDGTEYECSFGETTAAPEELRRILAAHLPAIGWGRKKVVAAIAGVDSLDRFEAVVKQFPPREGGGRWVVALVLLLAAAALVVGLTWGFFHFSGVRPPWQTPLPAAPERPGRGV